MGIRSYVIPRVARRRFELLDKNLKNYSENLNIDEKEKIQLDKFNRIWFFALRNIPFYQNWKKLNSLPSQLTSLSELNEFPSLTKSHIQENNDLILRGGNFDRITSTGGSTGQPTRFPMNHKEFDHIYANTYVGRGWWGVKPFERTALFWGHSHLFGSGFKGKVAQSKRSFLDFIVNIKRLNAYDMSDGALLRYLSEIDSYKPKLIIGYASSLYKLSRFALENESLNIRKWRPSLVISTSETLAKSEEKLIQQVFGSNVAQEYGLAEAGVVAYTKPESNEFDVFWRSFICLSDQSGTLTITTLDDRYFPLIKYQTDDLITKKQSENEMGSLFNFKKINGRIQHILSLRTLSGKCTNISGILIIHIMKSFPNIYSVQSRQLKEGIIAIEFVASRNVCEKDLKDFFYKEYIKKNEPYDKNAIQFKQVKAIGLSVAGKEIVSIGSAKSLKNDF